MNFIEPFFVVFLREVQGAGLSCCLITNHDVGYTGKQSPERVSSLYMKKPVLFCFILFLLLFLDQEVHAQKRGALTLSLNAIRAKDFNEDGLNLSVEYMFLDQFAVNPSWSTYLIDPNSSLNTLNVDFRYYTPLSGKLQVYGVLGLSRTTSHIDVEIFGIPIRSVENTENGINSGIGAFYHPANHLAFHAQIVYTTALLDDAIMQLGIAYRIKWKKLKE